MGSPRLVLEVFEPAKKMNPGERQKLMEEKTARMKAIIAARKEREAQEILRAEQKQRRKSLAPNLYDDDNDSSSCVSVDMGSSRQKSSGPPLQDTAHGKNEAASTGQKISLPIALPYTATVPAPTAKTAHSSKAPQANEKRRAESPPTKRDSNLTINTQKKRSYDAMSEFNSSLSRSGSNDDSPLFEQPSSTISPASAASPGFALASMPRISKKRKTSVSGQAALSSATNPPGQDLGHVPLPDWYLNAKAPAKPTREVMTSQRRLWDTFDSLKKAVRECENMKMPEDREMRASAVKKIGEVLHILEFTKVSAAALFKYKMLHPDQGLKRIANFQPTGFNFPWYLQADAKELFNKWSNGQHDPDMFRGIKNMIRGKDTKGGPSIDEAYKLPWKFFGEGNFVAGQWWANQLTAVRDGAHGSAQAGIAGVKTTSTKPGGATSIVLSEGHKQDIDQGEEIWYCGTEAKSGDTEETPSTKLMLESIESKLPVRVLRSSSLPANNKYKPQKGFRYDGLYKCLSSTVICPSKHHYLFYLKRIQGQIGLRYEGEAARPTKKELKEFGDEMRKFGRRKSSRD